MQHKESMTFLADIYFENKDDNVEISWNNDDYGDDVVFDCSIWGAKVNAELFVNLMNEFLNAYVEHWY